MLWTEENYLILEQILGLFQSQSSHRQYVREVYTICDRIVRFLNINIYVFLHVCY